MVGGIPFPKQPGESITTIVNFAEGRTYCKDICLLYTSVPGAAIHAKPGKLA